MIEREQRESRESREEEIGRKKEGEEEEEERKRERKREVEGLEKTKIGFCCAAEAASRWVRSEANYRRTCVISCFFLPSFFFLPRFLCTSDVLYLLFLSPIIFSLEGIMVWSSK